MKFPVAKPYIPDHHKRRVMSVLDSGLLSLGPEHKRFEEKFAAYHGAQFGCAVSSGTAGLHLALLAAGIGPGDEVITSPFSFVASANSILYVGAMPVFVDVDPNTYNMDPARVAEKITPRTKAILVVHIFGQSADMHPLLDLAARHHLEIIEDACESIGAIHHGRRVGTFGQSAVFAFYPNKQITTGEGGMIITSDERVHRLCKSLSNQGRGDDLQWLDHQYLGYNYRMDEMSAALGLAQLEDIGFMIAERRKIAAWYDEAFAHAKDAVQIPFVAPGNFHTYFVYVIQLLAADVDRGRVMQAFKERGIATKPYLPSIHLFQFYRERFGFKPGDFPVSETVSARSLALPFYIGLTQNDVQEIVTQVLDVLRPDGRSIPMSFPNPFDAIIPIPSAPASVPFDSSAVPSNEFRGKRILVTGGTGSIGFQIVRRLLTYEPRQVRILSRDDTKQFLAADKLVGDPRVNFLIGDVRDKERLNMAMENIDVVFHCAALKHVLGSERDPYEAVKTNVLGTQNVIECALANNVDKVIGISTDKAADPTSVLGITKLLAEKLMTSTHHYKGAKRTRFCFVRFGNVIGTRGSVIPLFCSQIKRGGAITLTDPGMHRFFMSIDDAVQLIFKAAVLMRDREVFILKMPIIRISDLAEAVIETYAPKFGRDARSVEVKLIGSKNGERMHEKLLGRDECVNALETPDMFIVKPFTDPTDDRPVDDREYPNAVRVQLKEYSTATPELAQNFLNKDQIKRLLAESAAYIEDALG